MTTSRRRPAWLALGLVSGSGSTRRRFSGRGHTLSGTPAPSGAVAGLRLVSSRSSTAALASSTSSTSPRPIGHQFHDAIDDEIALRTFDDTPRNGRAGIPIDNCPYR